MCSNQKWLKRWHGPVDGGSSLPHSPTPSFIPYVPHDVRRQVQRLQDAEVRDKGRHAIVDGVAGARSEVDGGLKLGHEQLRQNKHA